MKKRKPIKDQLQGPIWERLDHEAHSQVNLMKITLFNKTWLILSNILNYPLKNQIRRHLLDIGTDIRP